MNKKCSSIPRRALLALVTTLCAYAPLQAQEPPTAVIPPPDALDEARRLMPGADAYALQAEWQNWWAGSGRPKIRSADAAFLGWVKKRG